MASNTRKLKLIRKRKIAAQGKTRKAANRAKGTTLSKSELFGEETK